jgi:DNA-binding NarL/FixJ family response regulator
MRRILRGIRGVRILSVMLPMTGALADVAEASREAVSLGELAERTLDGLQRAFDCTMGCVTHSPRDGAIDILRGTDSRALEEYRQNWFATDPINRAIRRFDASWIIPASGLPEWPVMRRHPLYAEWAPSKNVRYLLHLRLSRARYLQSGATNVFLCRSKHGPDFGQREILALSQLLPELEAAVRRCERIAAMSSLSPFLETLLTEVDGRARLALRGDGRLIWASKAARQVLAGHLGRGRALPAALIEKVRELASGAADTANIQFATADAKPVKATLRTARASSGQPFVVIDLLLAPEARQNELRLRFRLTAAEADILSDLSDGLSNAQIAERRGVSVDTVRTHVSHVLSKLGVRSRLQAGVLARGGA